MARMGRYELLRPVGRGGMAEVFLARRRGPGGVEKQLVLKRIRPERVRDPRFLELFVREAELSMSLVHKNIVPVFDFGRAEDELFLVMEQVDGHDLGALLQFARDRDVRMEPLLVAFVGLEACQGLDYAHRRRDADGPRAVFHRDVTPGNLLVSRDGEVKLVDFGVAARETDLGEAGKVRGTPTYMAPEQARGEAVDGRADVYALGLVLWEALAGHRARQADGKGAMLALAREGTLPALPDDVPEALAQIVGKATEADKGRRYASARDMQLALDEYLVAARAEEEGGAPPSHRLAEWLDEVTPSETMTPVVADNTVSVARVVTYLDDGADVVGGGDSSETMRSIAETVAETGVGAGAENEAESAAEAESEAGGENEVENEVETQAGTAARPGRNRLVAMVLGGVVAVAGIAVAYVSLSGTSKQGASGLASTMDAAMPVRVAATTDAMVARPDAQPVMVATVADAAVAKSRQPPTRVPPPTRVSPPIRRKRKPDAGATPAPPAAALGTIKVSSSPWAKVTVAGRSETCADTPCTLKLPAGTHTLSLRNPVSGVGKRVQVQVVAGKVAYVRETLTRRP